MLPVRLCLVELAIALGLAHWASIHKAVSAPTEINAIHLINSRHSKQSSGFLVTRLHSIVNEMTGRFQLIVTSLLLLVFICDTGFQI